MDINSEEESSSIFKPFRSASKENQNIRKTTDDVTTKNSEYRSTIFQDNSQLPDGLKNCFAPDYVGLPLEDIDPFYANKDTFVVVNKKNVLYRFSSTNALWLLSPVNRIRSTAIRILVHPFYAIFMVNVILTFCLMLATLEPLFDLRYYLIIFLLEFLLKIVSYGVVVSPFSYLRNGWNVLDVVLNILLACGTLYLAELRVLQLIPFSLNLRKTVRLYWSSCKLLRDFAIYFCFMLILMSTLLLQIYMGTFTQICADNFENVYKENDDVRRCGNSSGSQVCPDPYVCLQGSYQNPDFGLTSFDTIFSSILSTFRLITRDFWENILHLVVATTGPWHIITFIVIIFIVSFQFFSVLWGQIAVSYNYVKIERWEKKLAAENAETEDSTKQEVISDKDTGCWSKCQRFFFFVIYNPYVVLFVIICIVLNTFCMALDHHDMERGLDLTLRSANYIFVLVFLIEAILKLLALGVVRYFKDEWNAFDFVVTVLGVIELGLEGVQGLSVFRSFRLLRPLRLGKIVPAFDLLLTRMRHLFTVVVGQTAIFLTVIYIFVVFGCRQFAKNFLHYDNEGDDNEFPLWSFTDPFHSFMVVFRALCGEWIETMILCLQGPENRVICYIYYICLVIVGTFQVMHIFTALLFTNDDSSALQTTKKVQRTSSRTEKFNLYNFLKDVLLEPSIRKIYDEYQPQQDIEAIGESNASIKMVSNSDNKNDTNETINSTETSIAIENQNINSPNTSSKIKESKYWRHSVTLCLILASCTLAWEYGPHESTTTTVQIFFFYIEYLFIGLLSMNLMLKSISHGWKIYVKDIWSWVDLFNIIVAIVGVCFSSQALLVLKAFRPLSLISRISGLKIIANYILKQILFLSNTILVCLAFWLIFAIMGVQLFGGKFYSCVDDNDERVKDVMDRASCDSGHHWVKSFMNFDDVIQSYYSLLQISTCKGWVQIINDAVDSREVNQQPIKETNIYMFIYFVIFIVCGVFLCLNVLVGILLQQMLQYGSVFKLLNQSNDNNDLLVGTSEKNEPTVAHKSKSTLTNFVRSNAFDIIAFASYLIYMLSLMCDYYRISEEFSRVLDYIHLVLAILLIIEVGVRGFGLRKEFFVNSWNRYDIVLVIFMIIDFFLQDIMAKYFASVHLLRIIRLFRFTALILSSSKSLQCSGKIISKTWKAISMLYLFLFLIICVYSLIGMALFEQIPIEFDEIDTLNFHSFGQSFILLIQVSTTSGWDGLLLRLADVNTGITTVYMLSFLFICLTILLNVVLLIAFEFYKEVTAIDDEQKQLSLGDVNDFNEKWETFTVDGCKHIPKNRLKDFFNSLDETSALRLQDANEKDFQLLGIQFTKDNSFRRSDLLIALNRIRLDKQQH